MKKFLSGVAVGIGVSVAAAMVYRKLLKALAEPLLNWDWNVENPLKPYIYMGQVVGIQFGNVVFALHDAPSQMNFCEAWDYCKTQKIGNKECCLPKEGMEKVVPAMFEALNAMLVKFGGEPLKAVENDGYWAVDNCEQENSLAWIIALHKNASDFYDRTELAFVRPVVFLEEEI